MDASEDRVLIVGAGPVGLCLALKLAKEGVASMVIEQLRVDDFLKELGAKAAATTVLGQLILRVREQSATR